MFLQKSSHVSHLGSELSDSGPRWQEGCAGAVLQMVIPQNSVRAPKTHLVFRAVAPGGVSFTFRGERDCPAPANEQSSSGSCRHQTKVPLTPNI